MKSFNIKTFVPATRKCLSWETKITMPPVCFKTRAWKLRPRSKNSRIYNEWSWNLNVQITPCKLCTECFFCNMCRTFFLYENSVKRDCCLLQQSADYIYTILLSLRLMRIHFFSSPAKGPYVLDFLSLSSLKMFCVLACFSGAFAFLLFSS